MVAAEESASPSIDLDAIRGQFPALAVTDNDVPRIYFDNPAGTQVPKSVADRTADCLLYANANYGGYFRTSQLASAIVDEARVAMADFINAPSPAEMMFGQSMTTLTFHLARSLGQRLQAGDEIVLSQMDHDANVQPWVLMARDHDLKVRWLPFNTETYEFELDCLDERLNDRTKLVCVGGASNLTGTINDINTICAKARAAGAWSFIDAVQSAPHVVTDVQAIGCDFLACSAYKFFGPHQGILWGRRDVIEQLEPYRVRPAPEHSFETGTLNHEAMAGTTAAVDYFAWIGQELAGCSADAGSTFSERAQHIHAAMHYLFAHELRLASQLVAGLQSLPGVTVRGITDPNGMERRVSTVSFTHESIAPDTIAEALAERNIFVWSGHNYALEVVKALDILDKGSTVRVGAVHYNSTEEVDCLLNALQNILS